MKISSSSQQERIAALENRRKILQRKEAGDAYRKNLQYFQPKKSPVLIELENLLFGHKDHDLYEQHKEESKEITPQEQAVIQEMQQTEKNVRAHEKAYKAIGGESSIEANLLEEDSLQILGDLRSAALIPANLSPQDLPVAANYSKQMQAERNGTEIAEIEYFDEEPMFVRESIEVKVPERFTKELKLDPYADTIFSKGYEEAYKARTFINASEKYATHTQMAKNGYRLGNESLFSMTA